MARSGRIPPPLPPHGKNDDEDDDHATRSGTRNNIERVRRGRGGGGGSICARRFISISGGGQRDGEGAVRDEQGVGSTRDWRVGRGLQETNDDLR